MIIANEQQIIELISKDQWMMKVLQHAQSLQLPDWALCAGFIRAKVWDAIHEFPDRTSTPDVDVVFFDPNQLDEKYEKLLEQRLMQLDPTIPWSVKNEARMHLTNNIQPYTSTADAISKFPETATAIGITFDEHQNLQLISPCGIDDLLQCIIKPTAYFKQSEQLMKTYYKRIQLKNWASIWPKVTIVD